jgi:anti-sigma B factor antagonist
MAQGVVEVAWMQGGSAVGRISGELSMRTAPRVHRQLLKALRRIPALLVLDLSALEAVDTAGMATLIQVLRYLRSQGGVLRLAEAGEQTRRMIALTRLESLFPLYDSVAAALTGAD